MSVDVQTARVRTARIELAGGQEVRLGRWPGRDGRSGHVWLEVTWPETPPGGRDRQAIRLPPAAVPELREALDALTDEGDP